MPTALGTIASHRTATTTGGLPVAGAVGWWDASQLTGANGSRVTTWPDLSGAGRNLTGPGPTLTTNGLNGKTVATYNPAANNSLTAPMVPFNQFFIVAKYDAATFVSYDGLLTDSANLALLIGNDGTSNWYNAGAPFDEYRKDGVLYSSPWPAPMQTWAVLSGSRSGPFILNDILLGYDRNIADRYWSGGIAELLIYDRVLSTVERQQVESYLHAKWLVPTGAPIPTTGLAGWWDADDASTFSYSSGVVVSQWRDKSGYNRHANTGGGSPTVVPGSINARPTLYITGYPCRLEIAPFAAAYTAAELFAVLKIKTLGGTGSRSQMLSMWGTNNEIGWYPFAGPPSWWYENWGIAERPAVGTVDNATLLAPHIHNIRVAPGSLTGLINGATIGTQTATVAFRSSGTYMFGNDFINEIPDGYIAEVVMYNRVLSTVERQQVERYLKTKWSPSQFYDYYDWDDVVGSNWPSHNGLLPALTGVTKTAMGVITPDQEVMIPAGIIQGLVTVTGTATADGYANDINLTGTSGWNQAVGIDWIARPVPPPPYDWYSRAMSPNITADVPESHRLVAGEVAMGAVGFSGTQVKAVAFPDTRGETILTGGWAGTPFLSLRAGGGGPKTTAGVRLIGLTTFSPVHALDWETFRDDIISKYGVTMRP